MTQAYISQVRGHGVHGLVTWCLAIMWGLAISTIAFAQTYPSKPIRMVVPFAAGGQTDYVARLAARLLGDELKQPIIVENVAGAGGMIAVASVANSPPDGYTLFFTNAAQITVTPYLQRGTTPIPKFEPVSTIFSWPLLIVTGPKSKYMSLAQVVEVAKKSPGSITYASPGAGSLPNLFGELFSRAAGIDLTHVAYKGDAPALQDVMASQVDLLILAPGAVAPLVAAGKIRPLATSSKARIPSFPSVPTMTEEGYPEVSLQTWAAVVAPAGTPVAITEKLNTTLHKVLSSDEVKLRFEERGFERVLSTAPQLGEAIGREGTYWAEFIKKNKITVE